MRKKLRILVVVLACTGVRAQEVESGFYAVFESGGVIVKGIDGNDLHLGIKLTDKIEKATIRSTRNDNERFALRVDKTTPSLQRTSDRSYFVRAVLACASTAVEAVPGSTPSM
jgi:hypothetical protein